MEIISARQFAERIGVSLTAIQKGVKTGRIKAVHDKKTGRITGIDWDTQQAAWTDNSKAPQRMPHNLAGGRPRKDGKPVAAPRQQPREGDVIESREPQPHGGALKRQQQTPPPEGQITMAEAQRNRELVKLQLDVLKLKEAEGELVNAAEQRKLGYQLGQTLISNLYNMPERLADEFAGMNDATEIHKLWVKELDAAIANIRELYGC